MIVGAYFKSFRRKIGVVTLAVACVVAAGLVRSMTHVDLVCLRFGPLSCAWISGEQRFHFVPTDGEIIVQEPSAHSMAIVLNPKNDRVTKQKSPRGYARWYKWPANRLSVFQNDEDQPSAIMMNPYWSVVLPLTLISAWLLLSKPRVMRPDPPPEPQA